jgi:hypothetical protein
MKSIIQQIPFYKFYLRDYKHPINISHAIGVIGATRYIYGFAHMYTDHETFDLKSSIIKYGKGADFEWQKGTWGSRVYRQAGNIPGWNAMLTGPNGSEMITDYIPAYQNQFTRTVHRDDVVLLFWDFTCYQFTSEHQWDLCLRQFENYFIDEHEKNYGYRPPGNVKNAVPPNTTVVADQTFDTLFSVL